MALISLTAPNSLAQHALLSLVRELGDPQTQIHEAAKILRVDLSETERQILNDGIPQDASGGGTFAPKEEWVFRWIQKKLMVGEDGSRGFRLNKESWVLVWILLQRLPCKIVARVLIDHKFTSTISQALREILDRSGADNKPEIISDSSSTLQGSPELKPRLKGNKRKRDPDSYDNALALQSFDSFPIGLLVLATVESLVKCTEKTENVGVMSRQQLMVALKTEPELAALILSRAYTLANLLLTHYHEPPWRGTTTILSMVSAFRQVWIFRTDLGDDPTGAKSNDFFAAHCAVPALSLLQTLSSLTPSDGKEKKFITELERLIACHLVIPLRSIYLQVAESEAPPPEPSKLGRGVDSILISLKAFMTARSEHAVFDLPTSSAEFVKLLPLLLDITLRTFPRRTLKQQSTESPWLEAFFVALANLTGFSPLEDTILAAPASVAPLEKLFEVAVTRKFALPLRFLSRYISIYSGVFDKSELPSTDSSKRYTKPCIWILLAKAVQLGVDIFIPNSGIDNATTLLDATFTKASSLRPEPSKDADEYYNYIKSDVIVPIIDRFSQARDLQAFITHWISHMSTFLASYEKKELRESSVEFPIWESEEVISTVAESIPGAYSPSQITEQFALAIEDFTMLRDGQTSIILALPRSIIVDTFLQAQADMEVDSIETILSLGEAAANIVASRVTNIDLHYRAWRILRRISNLSTQSSFLTAVIRLGSEDNQVDATERKSLTKVISQMMQAVSTLPENYQSWQALAACYESFQFLTIVQGSLETSEQIEAASSTVESIAVLVDQQQNLRSDYADPEWDGRAQTLDSKMKLSLACHLALLRRPLILERSSSASRRELLQGLYTRARQSSLVAQTRGQGQEPVFLQLWHGFATSDSVLNSPSILRGVLDVLILGLESNELEPVALETLLQLPLEAISRQHRKRFLDIILQAVLESEEPIEGKDLSRTLSLMLELHSSMVLNTRLSTDGGALFKFIEKMQSVDQGPNIIIVFEHLVASVLRSLTANLGGTRTRKYISTFFPLLCDQLRKSKSLLRSPNTLVLLKSSLPLLWMHKDDLLDSSLTSEIQDIRQRFVTILVSDLRKVMANMDDSGISTSVLILTALLGSLAPFHDLWCTDRRLEDILTNLTMAIQRTDPRFGSIEYQDDVSRLLFQIQDLRSQAGWVSVQAMVEDQMGLLEWNGLDVSTCRRVLQAATASLAQPEKDYVLKSLKDLGLHGLIPGRSRSRLYIIAALVSVSEITAENTPSLSALFSKLFGELAVHLQRAATLDEFCLASDCLNLLLRIQARSISQWNIDGALGAIIVATSPSGPTISVQNQQLRGARERIIFGRLCSLMVSVLGFHRKKVGGRFHLMLPALQGLMRCLFVPEKGNTSLLAGALPPWISAGNTGLDREHAGQYSRLLTTLCDPTVSSVTKTRNVKTQQLTDETKKARGVAGQYLQYLVAEYTQCRLHGQISSEMKSAMMPGLYAILDAMSRDGMRALNAAMDSSSRAIFKVLYDDYKRFGQWDRT